MGPGSLHQSSRQQSGRALESGDEMATARERSHSDVQEQTVEDRCSTGDTTEELRSPLQTWNTFCPILVALYSESRPVVSASCDPMDYIVHEILPSSQNTGVGSLSLLQGIFQTQGSNPGLLHCKRILYQLRYKGSPRILEWVAYPFSSGSS